MALALFGGFAETLALGLDASFAVLDAALPVGGAVEDLFAAGQTAFVSGLSDSVLQGGLGILGADEAAEILTAAGGASSFLAGGGLESASLGSIAAVLAADDVSDTYGSTHGVGDKSIRRLLSSAREVVYGSSLDVPSLTENLSRRHLPRLRNGKLIQSKAPADLSSLFGAGPSLHPLGWDGFYVKVWPEDRTQPETTPYQIGFQWGLDDKGGLYLPELLMVKYETSAGSSAGSGAALGPALQDSTLARPYKPYVVVSTNTLVLPEFRERLGLFGFDWINGVTDTTAITDLRDTNGNGIVIPLRYLSLYTNLGGAESYMPAVKIIYRYRKLAWKDIQHLVWLWLTNQEALVENFYPTDLFTYRDHLALIEFTRWYLFWGATEP